MAGKNNKKGRGSGGTISSAPPKPSGMKVNQFQEASRDARARNNQAAMRTGKRMALLEREPQRNLTAAAGGRKNIKGRATSAIANGYRAGKSTIRDNGPWKSAGDMALRKAKPGYSAPATRLY